MKKVQVKKKHSGKKRVLAKKEQPNEKNNPHMSWGVTSVTYV
jgi:hypothetical protein